MSDIAHCKDCLHYEPCFDYGNVLDPLHGGVICDSFKPASDVAPKIEVDWHREAELNAQRIIELEAELANAKREVAREIFEEVRDNIFQFIIGENCFDDVCHALDELKQKHGVNQTD